MVILPYARITFPEHNLANLLTLSCPIRAMIVFIKINSNNTFGTIPDTQLTNVSAPVSNNPMNPDAPLIIMIFI